MQNPPTSGFSSVPPPVLGTMGSLPPPSFPPPSFNSFAQPPAQSFGGDADDAYWDPSQLDNDPIEPPPPALSGGFVAPPPVVGPPPVVSSGSGVVPPPSSNPMVPPPAVQPPAFFYPGGGVPPPSGSLPPPAQPLSPVSIPPPINPPPKSTIVAQGPPGKSNMDAVLEHQKKQEFLRQQFQQGSALSPEMFLSTGGMIPPPAVSNVVVPPVSPKETAQIGRAHV